MLIGGKAKCWGDNYNDGFGIGNGSILGGNVVLWPTDVLISAGGNPLSGITDISAGYYEICAIMGNSTVKCWGDIPYDVLASGGSALSDVANITLGYGDCALMKDSTVKCLVGTTTGTTINYNYTTMMSGGSPSIPLRGITHISAGDSHGCVLIGGAAKCWGDNTYGQLGNGTIVNKVYPTDVLELGVGSSALSGITNIAAGEYHTCVLMEDSTAKCWGDNTYGQLGDGTQDPSLFPKDVLVSAGGVSLSGIAKISSVVGHNTCVIMKDETVKCWGLNTSGQLGNGTVVDALNPTTVLVLSEDNPLSGDSFL